MAVKTFTTGEVLTAADTNTYLNNGGLVYITEKSFTSTSSAQQIDNCLTTTYDAYRVVFYGVGNQASCVRLNLRFVDGTTPNADGNSYWIEVNSNNASGPTRTWASTNTRIPVGFIGNESAFCTFDFSGATSTTEYKPGTATYIANGTGDFVGGTMHFLKRTTVQYEGIQLYPDTGTWAGKIVVYGYRKA